MAAAAERGASLREAYGVWVSFQESLVQRNRLAEGGEGNGRARSTGEDLGRTDTPGSGSSSSAQARQT